MHENAEAKGRRYLTEGRVMVILADRDLVGAFVRGTGTVYSITYTRGSWDCSCEARGLCAHRVAVGLCTSPRMDDVANFFAAEAART